MNLEREISRGLWESVSRSYRSKAWSNAILDSIHFLSDAIRAKTDLQSDGLALVGQALGGKTPKLRLNRLQTESERNVQAGVEALLRGLYQAIRNPRSHERIQDTQGEADTLILFVDYLLRLIGHAHAAFSIDECVRRMLEKDFVPNERYASLLLSEIPTRHRLQVALTVYQRKSESDATNLRYIFDRLIPILPEEEKQELFDAISADLRESEDEETLRCILQFLRPVDWRRIGELPRLRSEHRLIRSLEAGLYNRASATCKKGALGTWSCKFWPYFTLKDLAIRILIMKLRAPNVQSQDYVLIFCFRWVDSLADEPLPVCKTLWLSTLKVETSVSKRPLDATQLWGNRLWNEKVQKARESFPAAEPTL